MSVTVDERRLAHLAVLQQPGFEKLARQMAFDEVVKSKVIGTAATTSFDLKDFTAENPLVKGFFDLRKRIKEVERDDANYQVNKFALTYARQALRDSLNDGADVVKTIDGIFGHFDRTVQSEDKWRQVTGEQEWDWSMIGDKKSQLIDLRKSLEGKGQVEQAKLASHFLSRDTEYTNHLILQTEGDKVVGLSTVEISPVTGNTMLANTSVKRGEESASTKDMVVEAIMLNESEARKNGLTGGGIVFTECYYEPKDHDPLTFDGENPDSQKRVPPGFRLRLNGGFTMLGEVDYVQPGENGCIETPETLFIFDYNNRGSLSRTQVRGLSEDFYRNCYGVEGQDLSRMMQRLDKSLRRETYPLTQCNISGVDPSHSRWVDT